MAYKSSKWLLSVSASFVTLFFCAMTNDAFLAPAKLPHGLTPPALDDKIHAARCLAQFRSKTSGLEKYIFLSMLKHENEDMFYKLCLENMAEFTPIIYTPTVGEACQKWSQIYRRPEGMVRILAGQHACTQF